MHLEPWWKRALLALAIVFCLVPLWRVSDSMPGQLLIVVGAAMVLFMVSELWRWAGAALSAGVAHPAPKAGATTPRYSKCLPEASNVLALMPRTSSCRSARVIAVATMSS